MIKTVLVIGLGSMGKRRIRNLQALGVPRVIGFDLREDRRTEAATKYGIITYAVVADAYRAKPDAVVISLPPELHTPFALEALDHGLPFFTEASVVSRDMDKLMARTREKKLVGVPSCTMRYFPGPRLVRRLLREDAIGKPLTWIYHCGQYLPDWHPWESIHDFYVSKRETGGAREIVPFELTWLTDAFGPVESVNANISKVSDLPVDIDDVYHVHVQHGNGMRGTLQIDVVARPAIRHLRILGSEGTIEWDGSRNLVRVWRASTKAWQEHSIAIGTVESGYTSPEEPYIEEMRDYLACATALKQPTYTLEEDHRILHLLEQAEEASRRGTRMSLHQTAKVSR